MQQFTESSRADSSLWELELHQNTRLVPERDVSRDCCLWEPAERHWHKFNCLLPSHLFTLNNLINHTFIWKASPVSAAHPPSCSSTGTLRRNLQRLFSAKIHLPIVFFNSYWSNSKWNVRINVCNFPLKLNWTHKWNTNWVYCRPVCFLWLVYLPRYVIFRLRLAFYVILESNMHRR